MSSDISVTVIIPVFNSQEYLEPCLNSVASQTLDDFEVIIVDDGSTDKSTQIAKVFVDADARFKLIKHDSNRGLPCARNTGMDIAKGKYLIHLDSDDFWLDPTTLETLTTTARLENCEILRFNGLRYSDQILAGKVLPPVNVINNTLTDNKALWHFRSVFLFLFDVQFIREHQLHFDEQCNIGEDGIFLSRALPLANRISSIPDLFYGYRQHKTSMMKGSWGVLQFLEEIEGSKLIMNALAPFAAIHHSYCYHRFNDYWVNKLLPRASSELTVAEQAQVYESYRQSLLDVEKHLGEKLSGGLRFIICRSLLMRKHYKLLAHFMRGQSGGSSVSVLNIGFHVKLAGKARWLIHKATFVIARSLVASARKFLLRIKMGVANRKLADKAFRNIEGHNQFDFTLLASQKTRGITAMLRVKDEEHNIAECVTSILPHVDEIVVVDNGSSDDTVSKLKQTIETLDSGKPIKIFSYPFKISRCGRENQDTEGNSVHSLTYYYNWCLSKCSTSLVLKWDADMRVSGKMIDQLHFNHRLASLRQERSAHVTALSVRTAYLDNAGRYHTTDNDLHSEVRLFPNRPDIHFTKGEDWEILKLPPLTSVHREHANLCYEIKDTKRDEFDHWTAISFRAHRKVSEYRSFMKVKAGLHEHDSRFRKVSSDIFETSVEPIELP